MNRGISFMPYNIASQFRITQGRYDKVYESSVSENDNSLDKIFVKYNIGRPEDFRGHSLSTSDIIVTMKDGEKKAYYCDSYGFEPLNGFFQQRQQSEHRGAAR